MAMRVMENEILKVMIADSGAELSSVFDKESKTERMWDADPDIWNRHAPILFPFVGRVVDGVYRYQGKEYEMKTQHGFARDMEFECMEENKNKVVHRLLPKENTRKIYPFEYELLVCHQFDNENPRKLHVTWTVKNKGTGEMFYCIGGHPGFALPTESDRDKENYYFEIPGREALESIRVSTKTAFAVPDVHYPLKTEQGFFKFSDDVYSTIIFDEQKIEKIRIAKPDHSPYITMECGEFPFLAIWSKKEGNFICLEPWVGRTDDDGFTGSIADKASVVRLEAGEERTISHSIEYHK